MTDTLGQMARARRLKALMTLDGPRRARPVKPKLFVTHPPALPDHPLAA